MHVLIPLMQFLADKGMASGEVMDIFGMTEGTSDVIQEKAAQLKDKMKEKAEDLKDAIQEKTHRGIHRMQGSGEDIDSGIPSKEDVSASVESLKGKLDEAKKQGFRYIEGGDSSQMSEKAIESENKFKDGSGGFREGVFEGIKDRAQGGVSKVKEQLGVNDDIHENARDVAQESINTVKDKASDIHERMGGVAQERMNKVSGIQERAKDAVLEGVSMVKEKASDAKEGANYAVQEGIGKMEEKASDAKERTKDVIQEGIGKMEERAGEVKERAKEAIQEGMSKVKEKASDVKEGTHYVVQEGMNKMQEKASEVKEGTQETIGEMWDNAHGVKEVGGHAHTIKGNGHQHNKVWDLLERAKERFRTRKGENGHENGLVVRVHELCSWVQRGEDESIPPIRRVVEMDYTTTKLDVAALQESYAHLMKSAIASIARSREVFEKAVEVNGRGDWKENYTYFAESAERALKGAEEMFERVVGKLGGIGNVGMTGISSPNPSIGRFVHTIYAKFRPLLRTLYLGVFSATYGMAMWMTFLSGHILSRVLPRQHLGISLEQLSSVYLRLTTCGLMLCASIHALMHSWVGANQSERWQYVNFGVSLVGSIVNTLLIEPKMSKVINEKLKLEKEEGRGQLSTKELDEATRTQFTVIDIKLKSLHRMASGFNLVVLGGLTWHLWYLANRLVL